MVSKETKSEIRALAVNLGFAEDGNPNFYGKKFAVHNNYVLSVDFANEKISYGAQIVVNDETTGKGRIV